MNLLRESWPLGWTPNADDTNGDPRGLLRADNLKYDQDGILSLIRGTKKISSGPFLAYASFLYSRTMNLLDLGGAGYVNNSKIRYAVVGTSIIRNYSAASKSETMFDLGIISGGGSEGTSAFGYGFGHTFITYGTKKVKDDGINQTNIGLVAPPVPGVSINAPPQKYLSYNPVLPTTDFYSNWEVIENGSVFTAAATYCSIDGNATTKRAVAMRGRTTPFVLDATALNAIPGTGQSEDIFSMNVRIGDTAKFVRVEVTFMLDTPTAPGVFSDFQNYYELNWYADEKRAVFQEPVPPDELDWKDRSEFIAIARQEFDDANPINLSSSFTPGINAWSKITAKRADFFRVGTDDAKTWANVTGIRVTFVGTDTQTYLFNEIQFIGGANGPLTGEYVYLQVDVQDNGFYTEKSLPSAITAVQNIIKSSTQVSPTTVNGQANQSWIFRAGGKLNGFYRINKQTGAKGFAPSTFTDIISDTDALRDNIRLDDYQQNLPDDIIGIETNFKQRNWYITYDSIFPSYRDNFSSFDSRFKVENAGRNVEYNLFITKVTADVLVLATNLDFYEITGTAGVIVQGDIEFFDINIRSLGIKSPAIGKSFVVREGNLFYLAADGLRVLSGSNCNLLTDGVDLLFRNETRHGIAPVKLLTNLTESYYIGISKGRLYFSCPQTTGARALFIYDFADKLWRYEDHGAGDSFLALTVEEDDQIIYSTPSYGDKFLRILDIGTLFDEANGINFKFLSVYDDNQQPRNRKDTFTFKLTADTGGNSIDIIVRAFTGADIPAQTNIVRTFTTSVAFTGKQERVFSVYSTLGVAKYYQVELNGTVGALKIYGIAIDYEARPEQVIALRIPPTNYNIAGRKRIQEIPMIIDTMGVDVTFTPLLDSVSQTPSIINSNDKALANHFFVSEKSAFNVGGLLIGTNVFEFYELVSPRNIELLPDPSRFAFIPYTNFNSSSRKRFIQYAIVIDTRGVNVSMIPVIDGVDQYPQTINTNRKQTVIFTFDFFAVGTDIACRLQGSVLTADLPFELYGLNLEQCISETLPPASTFLHIPYNNMGSAARKRFIQFGFTIDTFGAGIVFTPYVDGVAHAIQHYITNRKQTVIYTFNTLVTGVDIGGTIHAGQDFEFYGVEVSESITEKLPPRANNLHITHSNLGTSARKRISQFAFVIDTLGFEVTFIPTVDGVPFPSISFTTTRKQTIIYAFAQPTTGTDIGGQLYTNTSNDFPYDFEYYGPNLEESIYEKLPPQTKALSIPCTNFGVAAKKRIRTIPMVIDTFGSDVVYTPIVDGLAWPPTTFNTTGKTTVLHYFTNNGDGVGTPFGIDYCGTLIGANKFEFYELLKPENVETLPVGKKFDQFGPIEFARVGKIREILIRIVATGTSITYDIYSSDSRILTGSWTTIPHVEKVYSISVPKGINPNIFRMELTSINVFHRTEATVRVNIDGMQTANKLIKIK